MYDVCVIDEWTFKDNFKLYLNFLQEFEYNELHFIVAKDEGKLSCWEKEISEYKKLIKHGRT